MQTGDNEVDMIGQIQEEMGETEPMQAWVEMLFRIAAGTYETPYEIETFAQVADSEKGRAMHWLYEEVRYRKGQ